MADSIFVNLALKCFRKLEIVLQESIIYRIFQMFFSWLAGDARRSRFIQHINKDEKASFYVKYSVVFTGIQDGISKFTAFLRDWYTKNKAIIENSIVFRLFYSIGKDIISVLGVFICVQMIIPESRWHNIYNFVAVFFVLLVYLIKVTVDIRFNININKIDIAILFFMMSIIVSVVNSRFSIDSIKYLISYISVFIFSLVLVNSIRNKYAFMRFVRFIIAMSSLISIYGVYQLIRGIPVDPLLIDLNMGQFLSRVYSTLGNPNIYAGVLVLALPFYVLMYLEQDTFIKRFLTVLMGLLVLCNVALTYSRAAYLAVILSMVVFLVLKNKKMLPVVVVGGILLLPFIPSDIINRLLTLGKDTSSLYRFNIWETCVKIIKDNWLLGLGINTDNFKIVFSNYSQYTPPSHSHMFFLQIWLELGLLGIVSLLWMITRLVKWALKVLFEGVDNKMNNIIIANISSLAGILFFGLAENIGFGLRILYMFWLVIMLLMVSLNISGKQYKRLDVKCF